jgi:hypothetical protein
MHIHLLLLLLLLLVMLMAIFTLTIMPMLSNPLCVFTLNAPPLAHTPHHQNQRRNRRTQWRQAQRSRQCTARKHTACRVHACVVTTIPLTPCNAWDTRGRA